ncbi:MAG: GGDEF domain-containing protein [Magnetococcales bacterium]|nr:GGDEF domain-containing protein [Magnetococcales bacterium]
MGIIVNLKNRPATSQTQVLLCSRPSNLVEELDRYRRKTEELARIYDLHKRLSEKLDLASMVDAFSIWLFPFFHHELVSYHHAPSGRSHTVCSTHGPHRHELIEAVGRIMADPPGDQGQGALPELGMRYFFLNLNPGGALEGFLLLHGETREMEEGMIIFLEEVMEEMTGPLERALTYEDLYDQARRDALTGLVNRRVFREQLVQELAKAQRYDLPLSLASLDLDHFKAVNDQLGHGAGDAVLKRVSRVLSGMVRDSDILARIGGDEFSLILPNTELEAARHLLDRLCQAVGALDIQAPGAQQLGVSIGLACWVRDESLDALIERVDAALYRAKAAGRSQVSI